MGHSISTLYTNTITVENKILICALNSLGHHPAWCHPVPPKFEIIAVYKSSYRIKRLISEYEKGTLVVPLKSFIDALIDHEVEVPDYVQYIARTSADHDPEDNSRALDAITFIFGDALEITPDHDEDADDDEEEPIK